MRFTTLLLILFCASTLKAQLPYGIKWQKNYGGSGSERARDILPLSDSGHLVIANSFSNDGDVSGHHGTTSTSDAWIFRLDASHNIVWQKSIGGTANDYLTNVIKAADGNYVAVGTSYSGDFDLPANKGNADIWVLKFDINGNILWSKNFGGSNRDTANSIIQLPSGEYMIAGASRSPDGQVQSTFTFEHAIWNFRITETGDFITGIVMGNYDGADPNYGEDLKLLPDGNVVMSVRVGLPNQFNEDPQFPNSQRSPWLVKLTPQGQVIWKKVSTQLPAYNPTFGNNGGAIQLTAYGISVTTWAEDGFTVSNGDATQMILQNYDGSTTSFTKKFVYGFESEIPMGYIASTKLLSNHSTVGLPDSNLLVVGRANWTDLNDYSWKTNAFLVRKNFSKTRPEPAPLFMGGSGAEGFEAVKRDVGSHFIVAGYSTSSDGDLTGNNGIEDAWIVGITDSVIIQKNIITGMVYLDNNNNQLYDSGDKPFSQLKVKSSKSGQDVISFPYDGSFINEVDTGNFVTSVLTNPFYSVQPVSHNSNFTGFENVDSVDFAVSLIPGVRDYKVSLVPLNELLPGFEARYRAVVSNKGTDTMQNQMATLIKSSKLEYSFASPEPTSQSGDTLKWQINQLIPDSDFTIELSFYAASSPTLNLGDTITNTLEVDTTQDLTPSDNIAWLIQKSAHMAEPNSIICDFGETMPMSDYESGDYLSYTIYFQNTGTDTSFNISILDTLNHTFDPASLEMISSSHPYQLSLVKDRIYQWKFNGIALVDSNRNAPLSRGFIAFRARPVAGLNIGSVVSNSASIHFDHNLPVATSRYDITLTASKPTAPQLNGIKASYCRNEGAQVATIINLPAAGSGTTAEVFVNSTKISSSGNQFTFNTTALNNGANTIKVVYTNSIGSSSKEISVDIKAPVTPEFDLNSTANTVTDQSPAFTVSISNPVHGGTNPQYTFAKDKAFGNILQASSSSSSITIQPSTLSVGDNKIYARLETNETCYTDKYVLDSVLIVKSAPTGIVDPEFPGSKIMVGPNPFQNSIYVSGLQHAKSYLITIVNASGHIVWKKQVRNTDRLLIQENSFPAGLYWLHIRDEKKKRSLGAFGLSH